MYVDVAKDSVEKGTAESRLYPPPSADAGREKREGRGKTGEVKAFHV
jgi:hypothetical protein